MSKGGAQFTADELALVLSHYDLGTIIDTENLQAGNSKAPKKIITSQTGQFLLKRRPKGKDDLYRVAFAHSVQNHLRQRNYPVPEIVPTIQTKNTVLNLNNHIYELFKFIKGGRYNGSETATVNAGKNLAIFHQSISDFPNNFNPLRGSFHDASIVRTSLRQITHNKRQADNGHALMSLGQELTSLYNYSSTNVNQLGFESWKEQIIHGDWHPGNMLFVQDKIAAVIDFDSIKIAPLCCDIANGALQFSIVGGRPNPIEWPEYLDIEKLKYFIRGYLSIFTSEKENLAALPDLMIETMIAESVLPVAATGFFVHLSGDDFLKMITKKCNWIKNNKDYILSEILNTQ